MILKCPSCEFFWQANCEDECNIDCIELTSYTDGRVLSTLPSIDDNAFFYCKRCHYVCWRRDVRTSDQDCRLTFSAKLFLRREARPPAEVVLTLLPGDDVVTELNLSIQNNKAPEIHSADNAVDDVFYKNVDAFLENEIGAVKKIHIDGTVIPSNSSMTLE